MNNLKKKHPIFIVTLSYVLTIVTTRVVLFIAEKTRLPDTIFDIYNIHIHHFVIGIALLVMLAFFNLFSPISKHKTATIFGAAIALVADEFSIWLKLTDSYWSWLNFVSILTITIGFVGFLILTLRKKKFVLTRFPNVSVVIPAHNEAEGIGRTIRLIKNQNYKGNVEIIVVDNNSKDSTAEISRNLGAIVISETRRGVSYARQSGFMQATGEIIFSTDADTRVPRNWIQRLVGEFEKNPKAVVVSGMYDFYDGNFILRYGTKIFMYPLFVIFKWYSGANMAIKKTAYLKVGGFDIDINISEDSDICNRLRAVGKVHRLPFFMVQTSARRFNQLGLIGGIWDYSYTYFKLRTSSDKAQVKFRSGSEVRRLGFFPKLAINMAFVSFVLLIIGIRPVRAEILEHKNIFQLKKAANVIQKYHKEEQIIFNHVRK